MGETTSNTIDDLGIKSTVLLKNVVLAGSRFPQKNSIHAYRDFYFGILVIAQGTLVQYPGNKAPSIYIKLLFNSDVTFYSPVPPDFDFATTTNHTDTHARQEIMSSI